MNDQHLIKKEQAKAKLALQIESGDRKPVGAPPSAEDLAAFYDQRLDEGRRAQVMSYIANDPNYYKRWLSVVEAGQLAQLDMTDQTLTDQSATVKTNLAHSSFITKVGEWLKSHKITTISGSGFAAAAALVLMVNIGGDSASDIDGLYKHYGKQWQAMPDMPLPKRGTGNLFGEPKKSPQREALEAGLAGGLNFLGPQFAIEGIDKTALATTTVEDSVINEKEYNALFHAGRIAALSHFKCQLSDSADYYRASKPVISEVVTALADYGTDEAKQLVKTVNQHQSETDVACAFSREAINIVRSN